MLFSSIPFLYYFLPCVTVLYYVLPKRCRNVEILAASLIFYGWGEPKYVWLMAASVLIGYVSGIGIEALRRRHKPQEGTVLLAAALTVLLGLLAYFKYADFFISNFNTVTGLSVPLLRLSLPIGISFYMFQLISYLADVYRGEVPAKRNLLHLAVYITMFPQLIAGPIVRYSQIEKELGKREHTIRDFALGIRRFTIGISKKVLIANILGELCESFRASEDKSVLFYWIYAAAYTLHIYFDFSGYSDMAIGLGRLFGFHFPENFNYPYVAGSITQFWRRWHMSLGVWFRDYVYIPLGGNRRSRVRWLMNIFIVWMLTGLWHGAAWNFVIWGLFYAVLLVLEKLWISGWLGRNRAAAHVYVVTAVMIGFVIFGAADMGEALTYLAGMAGMGAIPFVSEQALYYLQSYGIVLAVGGLGATPLCTDLIKRIRQLPAGERILNGMEPVILTVLMLLVTAYLVDGSFNPFLYFRF